MFVILNPSPFVTLSEPGGERVEPCLGRYDILAHFTTP
jgi:hypothetical protein